MSSVLEIFTSIDLMYLILAVVIVGGLIFLWKINNDNSNPLKLTDLITTNGRINERKFCRFGAWVVSTWGFIYFVVDHNLSIEYFSIYISVWAANALVGKAINNRNKPQEFEEDTYRSNRRSYISKATPIPSIKGEL